MRIGLLLLLLLTQGYADRAGSLEQRIFAAVNDERRAHGVPALRWSGAIAEQARHHSQRMLDRKFFSHIDPQFGDPSNRLSSAGIGWRTCGENIYEEYGFGEDPVRSAIQSWLRSPGHRKNMLSGAFTHTGVGVAVSAHNGYTITQMFVGR